MLPRAAYSLSAAGRGSRPELGAAPRAREWLSILAFPINSTAISASAAGTIVHRNISVIEADKSLTIRSSTGAEIAFRAFEASKVRGSSSEGSPAAPSVPASDSAKRLAKKLRCKMPNTGDPDRPRCCWQTAVSGTCRRK